MIEITANLVRADAPIFVTGERVECLVEFVHKVLENDDHSNDFYENLAWASVQLHCYRKTSTPQSNNDKTLTMGDMAGKTALDASQSPGDAIIATKPKILFCDLTLKPNETKTCGLLA